MYQIISKLNDTVSGLWKRASLSGLFLALLIIAMPTVSNSQSTAQQITVNGTVVDEKGEPIIGASVLLQGTSQGTITNLDGQFSLKATVNGTLVISYIGFTQQKVKITGSNLKVVLAEESVKLQEFVSVGYGSVKRANLTGAVSNISMKEVEDIPAPNLASVLMGTMPGVNVGEVTGNPIAQNTISIRINGSWNAEEPLFVIDGFIRDLSAFNMLDPSEIENISVLKDAAASVYGVRGAGGVVLVSTKKGKAGKTKVSYSGSYGYNQGVSMPNMMSSYEQGVALNDLWQQNIDYRGSDPATTQFFTQQELESMKGLDYNWLTDAWKNSGNMRHTLNVSGGTDAVKYFVGGSYMYADGNFSNLFVNRYGIRVGVQANLTKKLKADFSMDYNQKNTQMPLNQKDAEPDRMYGTFSDLARAPRFIPAYINGIPVGNSIPSNGTHPLEVMNSGSYRRSLSNDFSAGMSLQYEIEEIKGLNVKISANISNGTGFGKQLSRPYYVYGFIPQGADQNSYLLSDVQYPITDARYSHKITNSDKIYQSSSNSYSYQINPSVNYSNKFGLHDVSAMIMFEQSESGGNGISLSRQGVIIENYEVMKGYSQDGMTAESSINTVSRRQSYISRLNYNYADKYFFEGAARYEASTNFAPGYRWGLFPSVATGWRISEEPFFKESVDFMDNLKLRVSYGRLGNDKVSMNQWRSSYNVGSGAYLGGSSLLTYLSPDMEGLIYYTSTWEKSDSYNAGLDMRFFGELSANVDVFFRHTFDILDDFKSEFPQSAGVNDQTPKLNTGIQDAWGGEFELAWNKQINKDWSITVKGNMAYATNKVIQKSQNPGVIGTWKDELGRIRGGEVGYSCMGIARSQSDVDNYISYLQSHAADPGAPVTVLGLRSSYVDPSDGQTKTDMYPGMLMYADVGSAVYQDENGKWHDGAPDGNITDDDQRIISKYDSPPFHYGFSLGFKFKSIKVDALFNGNFGNDVLFEKGFWTTASGGSRTGDFLSLQSNQLREWYGNYWTPTRTDAIYPRLDQGGLRQYRSTFWMRNGHDLRLRTINVSYSLPNSMSKKVGIEQCRIFFSGTNLITLINPYPYKDASVGFWSDYPMIRSFNMGLNLNF